MSLSRANVGPGPKPGALAGLTHQPDGSSGAACCRPAQPPGSRDGTEAPRAGAVLWTLLQSEVPQVPHQTRHLRQSPGPAWLKPVLPGPPKLQPPPQACLTHSTGARQSAAWLTALVLRRDSLASGSPSPPRLHPDTNTGERAKVVLRERADMLTSHPELVPP